MLYVHQMKMDLINQILSYDGRELRTIYTAKGFWVRGKDIAAILGYKNTNDALIKHIDEEDKQTMDAFFGPGNANERRTIYINKKGLTSLIQKNKRANKDIIKWFCDQFDLNLNLVLLTKEQEHIGVIASCLHNEILETQFTVGKYRIDLYLPKYKIAIECDEYGHKDRDPEYEKEREEYIRKELGCVFYRFNPDMEGFNVYKVVGDVFSLVKLALKR